MKTTRDLGLTAFCMPSQELHPARKPKAVF